MIISCFDIKVQNGGVGRCGKNKIGRGDKQGGVLSNPKGVRADKNYVIYFNWLMCKANR